MTTLKNYSYKFDCNNPLQARTVGSTSRFFGIELEGFVPPESIGPLSEALGNMGVLKEDSSIDPPRFQQGLEIVSAPLLRSEVEEFARTALSPEVRFRANQSCGFHVHVSRASISQLALGRALIFFNSPCNQRELQYWAERESNGYAYPARKKMGDTESLTRYEVVNTTNADTIEFRLFAGTNDPLRVSEVIEDLEFILRYLEGEDPDLRWSAMVAAAPVGSRLWFRHAMDFGGGPARLKSGNLSIQSNGDWVCADFCTEKVHFQSAHSDYFPCQAKWHGGNPPEEGGIRWCSKNRLCRHLHSLYRV